MNKWIKNTKEQLKNTISFPQIGIQLVIASSFTLIACITILIFSIIIYNLFSNSAVTMKKDSAEQFLNQTKRTLEDYLRNNRRISDALYYSCIKNADLSEEGALDASFNLVYEANKDNIERIALYTKNGKEVNAVPVSLKKDPLKITQEDWFEKAKNEVENLHFSMPHVMDVSDESAEGYHWILSLSRSVELIDDGAPISGVLLVDMRYSGIQQLLEKVNSDSDSEYIYLCNGEGDIIYHPKLDLMNAGLYEEATRENAVFSDGSYEQRIGREDFIIVTKTVSYTGWKLVSVIAKSGYSLGIKRMQYVLTFCFSLTVLGILLINQLLSRGITSPLIRLNRSIREIESGDLSPEIYIGGPREVEHLGKTLQSYVETIQELMDEVIREQELKRRSELDALQSQINPHFLYNTLDSVMWMIEDEQNDGAVYMIKELAKLLRISISKGRTVITIRDEIRHAQSYMNIQNIRYKNQFSYTFDIDDEILLYSTVKLVIQPLLENAIYHGVQGMEDDGEITIRGFRDQDDIYIDVIDNGYGMTAEQVQNLLTKKEEEIDVDSASKRGNGVGLKNVDSRIKMRFGQEYGLEIQSERGEGTRMRIHLPAMEYSATLEEELNHVISKKNRDEV